MQSSIGIAQYSNYYQTKADKVYQVLNRMTRQSTKLSC